MRSRPVICKGRTWVFLFLLVGPAFLWGQNREGLEKERMKIIEQIDRNTRLLDQTSRNKSATLADLELIQEQIRNRKRVIETLEAELALSESRIDSAAREQHELAREYIRIRQDYDQLIRMSYHKMLTENPLVYLLSASDWEESLQRVRYLSLIENYLREKLKTMDLTTRQIEEVVGKIQGEREDKTRLLAEMQEGYERLEKDEERKDRIVQQLQGDEKRIRGALIRQRKDREALNKAIEEMILARLSERNNAQPGSDARNAGNSFALSKGKLPWPMSQAAIISRFGKQKHPTLENVFLNNNGIDIQSAAATEVKSVFDGEVAGTMQIPGNDFMVMIRHDAFYTVYSRLQEVLVIKGQKVSQGQPIGKVNANDRTLHFEIWEQTRKLDPAPWLR